MALTPLLNSSLGRSTTLPMKDQIDQFLKELEAEELPAGEISVATKIWVGKYLHELEQTINQEDWTKVNKPAQKLAAPRTDVREVAKKPAVRAPGHYDDYGWFEDELEILGLSRMPSTHALGRLARNGDGALNNAPDCKSVSAGLATDYFGKDQTSTTLWDFTVEYDEWLVIGSSALSCEQTEHSFHNERRIVVKGKMSPLELVCSMFPLPLKLRESKRPA